MNSKESDAFMDPVLQLDDDDAQALEMSPLEIAAQARAMRIRSTNVIVPNPYYL